MAVAQAATGDHEKLRQLIRRLLVPLCSNILGGFAGVTSDANTLVNYARNTVQNVLLRYDDDIPVEHLTQYMCDLKQGYTQYGGELTRARTA